VGFQFEHSLQFFIGESAVQLVGLLVLQIVLFQELTHLT
jgi:hypothetical protein